MMLVLVPLDFGATVVAPRIFTTIDLGVVVGLLEIGEGTSRDIDQECGE
jgi:hypothetical protein